MRYISLADIKALSRKGLGVKAIAGVLTERLGEPVSFMTVWRRLREGR